LRPGKDLQKIEMIMNFLNKKFGDLESNVNCY